MITLKDILEAEKRIRPWIVNTPLTLLRPGIWVKCENEQITGSFKFRGCMNALLDGDPRPRICRSSGNFGVALAYGGRETGIPVTVVMPEHAPRIKVEKARAYGAEVILAGKTHREGEEKVQEIMKQKECVYISPFNDEKVMAGQASIVLEINERIDTFFCPVGGGGSMAGCATALKLMNRCNRIVAVEPESANDYFLSRKAGRRLENTTTHTIADGLRTPSVGEKNWPILEKYVDEIVTISDEEIINAIRELSDAGIVAEPSGAISLAAAKKFGTGNTVSVISGGNVDQKQHAHFMQLALQA